MKVSSFYPKFPLISTNELDPYSGTKFNDAIVTKKEFAIERLRRVEPLPSAPGEYLRHQKYIARYMSVYDELLLFHEPGTGKTCTAVAAVEMLRNANEKTIKSAVVCAKGEGLTKNFLQELMFTCTDGRYIPDNYESLTELQKTVRLKKSANQFYYFKTFETFAKELSKLTDNGIRNRYEDTIFILDEAHNLRDFDEDEDDEDVTAAKSAKEATAKEATKEATATAIATTKRRNFDVYSELHRLFHVLQRRKIILMTGTPIKDTPDEFASLVNLILPLDKQIEVKTFVKRYFNKNNMLVDKSGLAETIKGRVSYLVSATTTVQKRFVGSEKYGKLEHFIVSVSEMSDFQSEAYKRAYTEDKGIYVQARQASLFVFPDGSYGQKGYNRYIKNKNELVKLMTEVRGNLGALQKYSAKYAQVVDVIISPPEKSKHFVYCQYVNGSGAIVFSKILEAFGFRSAVGNETSKGKRYALCTRNTATSKQIQRMVNRFNADDNVDGEYISVIIGSRVLNEGFTLKNIRNEFILTGHWNYAEIAQAIARGWRLGSHDTQLARGDLDVHVDVYQCVSVSSNKKIPSIDLELYVTSERKDVVNRQIERLVKETSFDCPLAIKRNKILGYDGQRECDYQSCDYQCDGSIGLPLDDSTYNMLKEVKDKTKLDVRNRLMEIFAVSDKYGIDDLYRHFGGDHNREAILEAIVALIGTAELFYTSHGFPRFLRMNGNELFLSTDPNADNGLMSKVYARILEPVQNIPFSKILDDLYSDALPDLVSQLFEYTNLTRKLIVELPVKVQRLILQACIVARDMGIDRNVETRDDILDFFNGFYGKIDGRWTIWLHADVIGNVCYDETTNSFIECENIAKTVALKKSPVGWYGMYNPTTKDFCIRDVKEAIDKDLRKITVGKRCINYDKSILASILDDDIKLASEGGSRWVDKSKTELCDVLKDWFDQNELMETNFDCGTSKKRRGKFA